MVNGSSYFYRIDPDSGKFDKVQVLKLINNNDDGLSVSLYGNYLVVGDSEAKTDYDGAVYFYRINRSSGKFDLIQTIDSPSPGPTTGNDDFGGSVSLYGNYLIVGDYNAKTDGDGAVYFYRINPSSGKFDLIQTIDSPSPRQAGDSFGASVSLYGNYLIVGDYNAKTDRDGAVYFYRINRSSGKFDLIQTIDSPSPGPTTGNDDFGGSVSLYGNYLVVGDHYADSDNDGAVYFYRINPSSGKFDLIQTIGSPSPIQTGDKFGESVSLYGNYLVVGDHDAKTDGDGAVYFYRINRSSGKFDLIQTIDSPSPGPRGGGDFYGNSFGISVSLYGNYLVVGDYDAEDNTADNTGDGRVYFYRIDPSSGKFDLIQNIVSPSPYKGGDYGDDFGMPVSLYGNYLVVGDLFATA